MGIDEQPFLVEQAKALTLRLQVRHQLRILWAGILDGYQPDITSIAADLGINVQWLAQQLTQLYTFGLLWENIEQRQQQEGIWAQRWQKVEIRQAIAQLRLYLDKLRKKGDRPIALKLPSSSVRSFTNLQLEPVKPRECQSTINTKSSIC